MNLNIIVGDEITRLTHRTIKQMKTVHVLTVLQIQHRHPNDRRRQIILQHFQRISTNEPIVQHRRHIVV